MENTQTETSRDQKILIIGAGVSGLIAAYELEKQGFSPVILEASDHVGGRVATTTMDGIAMDHGFQVLLTAYPEAQHYLDYKSLDLKFFKPGALVYMDGRFAKFVDPVREPSAALPALFSPVGSFRDKWLIFKLQKRLKHISPAEIFSGPDISTMEFLKQQKFSNKIIEQFFRPFFGGIFLEKELSTSSRLFNFVFKMFAEGYAAIPAKGMAEIPRQLFGNLKKTTIKFNCNATEVFLNRVIAGGHDYPFDRLIITIAPDKLMPNLTGSGFNAVTNMYFSSSQKAVGDALIMLSGETPGLINNMHFVDTVLPVASKRHVLSVTVIEPQNDPSWIEEQVKLELKSRYGFEGLELINTFHIPYALPQVNEMSYTTDPSATMITENIFMAGDQLLYPSLNAAMTAGRLAAQGVMGSFT